MAAIATARRAAVLMRQREENRKHRNFAAKRLIKIRFLFLAHG
jgi:hypothetical protein